MAELPYQAEYAKSGRASCKGCKEKIEQGDVRIAVMVQSAFYDGKQPNWHHEQCFFKRQRPKSADDIANLNKLRHEDQKRIKEQINDLTGTAVPESNDGKKKGKKRKATGAAPSANGTLLQDFAVEYSKSSRATCRICDIKICKDEVRISKTVFDTEIGQKYGGQALWHHVKCFAEDRGNLLYFASGGDLPGFKKLTKEDQKIVKDEIKPLKGDEIPIKKIKEEPKDESQKKEEAEIEKKVEKQNKLYFKYRDALSKLKKIDVHELLEVNSQAVFTGIDECLNHLADCMAFGALEPCSDCKDGQLILDNFGYKCTGDVTEWTKCSHVTQKPKRKPFVVPSAMKKVAPFKRYKAEVGERIFTAKAPPSTIVVKKEEPDAEIKKEKPIPPLKNLQFFIYGRNLKQNKEKLKHQILKLGGLIVNNITDTTAAVISTKEDVEKMTSKMQEISDKDIEVIEDTFLKLIDREKGTIQTTLQLIKENNIAPWGNDPKNRIPQDVIDGKSIQKSGSQYAKSKSASTKLRLKGGTAVDPESELDDIAHVYTNSDGTKYTVVLSKTDIVAQKNSYYKLQVLQADAGNKCWLFRSWGRIGTTVGNKKLEGFKSIHDAVSQFENLYLEKTQNPWECRHDFVKMPEAYFPVEMDYGEADSQTVKLEQDKNCKLPMPVQELVMKIFDINLMKKTLVEFELDTDKMPLGKLSKKQITNGYLVLTEVLKLIGKNNVSKSRIIDYTNRFYTLIPHSFGLENPPLLDSEDAINKKKEMLDSLLEIEIAYSLLQSDSNDSISPIEAHYLKLKSEIVPVVHESPEFGIIKKYVTNTHAATHSNYTLDIEQVFKVVRQGEDKRYKPFRKLHNRRLLWHGSRITNFAGILSQGLRIAPPEAPVTGYMFGKGIYFADMVSKSANYCYTNTSNPTGVMLLCEVALGNMKECHRAENVSKLPPNINSVWGMGSTQPDPLQNHTLEDGVIVPLGTPVTRDINTSLLYNEFIVYDVAQVNVKYLLQLKFNYKY